MERVYYSQRIGRGPLANPTIEDLARALTLTVDEMWKRDYLQEWHGFVCVDAGAVSGRAAMPLEDHIEAETGWRCAWPLPTPLIDLPDGARVGDDDSARLQQSAEDQLFDLIEYFHGHVSQGTEDDDRSSFHGFSSCGWHYGAFESAPAQAAFRQRMNRALRNYRGGFRINENGQVEHTADEGLDQLIDAPLLTKDPDIAQRVAGAIALYRNRGRTEKDFRLAVRELFDVLEKLRPHVKEQMLRGDEADLFNIAKTTSAFGT